MEDLIRNYFITTYGCQANIADSENIAGMLEALGLAEAGEMSQADLIVINSCSVRQASEDKVYGLANEIRRLREMNPRLRTVLTGCLVGSATGDRPRISLKSLESKTPWVDFYLNINELNTLPTYLLRAGLIDEWLVKALSSWRPQVKDHQGVAYVNISQGCDNFCTFCVVPYSRGKEMSRPEEEILNEINQALSRGFRKIMLLGQNVNSWMLGPEEKILSRRRLGKIPFAELLRKVHGLKAVEKIKFITSNPFDFSADLVEALKLPKIDRYLHLPVQSGDSTILKKMGRRHTREDYLELVAEIREAVPEIELGTDVIVGFPGETEEQFMNTVSLLKEVRFNVAFVAMYSPRPGTASLRIFRDDVPVLEKKRRHAYLTQVRQEVRELLPISPVLLG